MDPSAENEAAPQENPKLDDNEIDENEIEEDNIDGDGGHEDEDGGINGETEKSGLKSALKKPSSSTQATEPVAPPAPKKELPPQPNPEDLNLSTLTPLSPEIIARQATINIGTIGHVAHGKSTVVKAISGVQTVRFKRELVRNITIKLGYANAKVYKCDNPECPRPTCFKSYQSDKEVDPPCERKGCSGTYRLHRHVS